MATKTTPQTATGVAFGMLTHIGVQAATTPPRSTVPRAANHPPTTSTSLDMDTTEDDTLQSRVKKWKAETLKSPPDVDGDGWESDLESEVRDTSKTKTKLPRLNVWGESFEVPVYKSWDGAKSAKNIYNTFYTYQTADPFGPVKPGGSGTWQLDVAKNVSGKPAVTPLVPPSEAAEAVFATEHVFEVQIVAQFFTFLRVPQAAQDILLEISDSGRSPMEDIAAKLPSGDSEFIYLQAKLNGIKKVYFEMGRPTALKSKSVRFKDMAEAETKAKNVLRKMTLTALLAGYMNQKPIFTIYNNVRGRIETYLKELANSTDPAYTTTIKPLDLLVAFQKWHQSFIELVEQNMQESIDNGLNILQDILAKVSSNKPLQTQLQSAIEGFEAAKQKNGLDKVRLRGLMTQLNEAPADVDLSKLELPPGNRSEAPSVNAPAYSRGDSVEPQFDADDIRDREDPEVSTVPAQSSAALKKKATAPKTLPPKNTPGGANRTPRANTRADPRKKT